MVWVCRMCSTNNYGHKRRCFVCDQKRPLQWFKPSFKFKADSSIKRIELEEKIHTALVSKCREFFFSLVALMGILLTVIVILRAVAGDLPEVLNTLSLLGERLGAPFERVGDNFTYCMDGVGDHFKALGEHFLQLFPYIGKNLQVFGKNFAFVIAKLASKIQVLFGNVGRIIARIAESIVQFVERIGA